MHFIPSDIIKIAVSNMTEAIDPLNAAKTRLNFLIFEVFIFDKKVFQHSAISNLNRFNKTFFQKNFSHI